MNIQTMIEKPIKLAYPKPSLDFINELKEQSAICEITPGPAIIIGNDYYKAKHPGTHTSVFTRHAILTRLHKVISLLHPHYGIYVFDAFRTRATQRYLFDSFFDYIHAKKPYLTDAELQIEVRKYVSHPDEPARFAIPPHNSGGAIDLALFDLNTRQLIDFGCVFDETEVISSIDYFEQPYRSDYHINEQQWINVRNNRRILFHTMVEVGFTNYSSEWWHYDLGDCMWANIHGLNHVFNSMEPEVLEFIQAPANR